MEDSTDVELTARQLRALGDPIRLQIVRRLESGTTCVCDLRKSIGVTGPLLSHHLAVLRNAGLVTAARRGRWVDYTLDTVALDVLVGSLQTRDSEFAS
jgi:ArsR family transcriptional regulator